MRNILLGLCLGAALGFPLLAFTLDNQPKSIEVKVDVSKSLIPENADNWPLYVYAARPNTRMPLSSFKGKFSDLPINITLNESMYLLPELTLKDAEEVVVVAKVSKSLDPHKKSAEDLIGFSEVLSFKDSKTHQIVLTIDQNDRQHSNK